MARGMVVSGTVRQTVLSTVLFQRGATVRLTARSRRPASRATYIWSITSEKAEMRAPER
jgi:hypothetical protein